MTFPRVSYGAGVLFAFCAVCVTSVPVDSQAPVQFDREHSDSRYGAVIANEAILLAPLAPGPGRVFVQPLLYRGSLRLHFTIASEPTTGSWALQIVDGGTMVWRTTAADESNPRSFWSDEVSGSHLVIEVYANAGSAGFQLTVDKVALASDFHFFEQATTDPRDCKTHVDSMTPPLERGCQPVDPVVAARVRTWAPSIARLRIVADSGTEYYCSGFLVAADLLMTNWHCVQSQTELEATRVDFDYDRDGAKPLTLRLLKRELPDKPSALDFAILRLKSSPNRPRLRLRDVAPATQALVIIQHPDGQPKQVSIEDCKVTDRSLPGMSPKLPTDFGHYCDTYGGSSGSPTQDAVSGDVIGLHHLGFRKGNPRPQNQAVRIGLILDAIRNENAAVFSEIAGGGTEGPRLIRQPFGVDFDLNATWASTCISTSSTR